MGVDLTLTNIKPNGELEAVYSFYPMPGNTTGKSGSYKMTGSYNSKTLEIDLNGSEWIERPSWLYGYVNIHGIIKVNNNSIVSDSNNFHVFTDTVAQRIEKTPMIYDELSYLTDTQIQELQTAIDSIHSNYGVGIVIILTSTEEDTWDYMCDYWDNTHTLQQYNECGILCINVDGRRMNFENGFVGDKLDKYSLILDSNSKFYDYFVKQPDKSIQEYVLSINRFLGGKDSDFNFSW